MNNMPELFGYIPDTSSNYSDDVYNESQFDDCDIVDQDVVYNEMDGTVAEFDTYVQEGLGVAAKILIGVGIAAALAGLIALIIKLYKKKKGKSAAAAAEKTEKVAKDAAKKYGGKKPVKTKKRLRFRLPFYVEESATDVDFDYDYFQEAVYNNGIRGIKNYLDKDVSFIEELGEILADLYRTAKSETSNNTLSNKLNISMKKSKDLVDKYRAKTSRDVKVSDIVDSRPSNMTLDDVIEEAYQVRDLCNDITEMGNRLQKVQRKIQNSKTNIDQYDNVLSRECKKLEEKVGQPAITKLQKKIITISDAVQEVMNEYLSAIYNIGENSDDIVTTVRANANIYDLESGTKSRSGW